MPERKLEPFVGVEARIITPTTAWSYEDQKQALLEGFNSVAEWGLFHAVRKVEALEARMAAIEALTHGPDTGYDE